jgi:hypothetical protein
LSEIHFYLFITFTISLETSDFNAIAFISIPSFSQRNVKIIPSIHFASIGSSYPAFGSRSDLRYVPTLRTFLRLKCFLIRVGSPGPGCSAAQICLDFPAIFPRDFSPRFIPAIFPRDFFPRFISAIYPCYFFPRNFPAIFHHEISPRNFPAILPGK